MRKNIIIISIGAAVLMILLPMSAVVGTDDVLIDNIKKKGTSPLFLNRVKKALQSDPENLQTNYIGKNRVYNLFSSQKTSIHKWLDKALKVIDAKPEILTKIINRIYEIPELVDFLKKHGISKEYLYKEIITTIHDSTILHQKVEGITHLYEKHHIDLPNFEPPKPLGFSGELGCGIVFFLVVLPLIMMIGGFLGGMLAVIIPGTFLVPGCLEWIFQTVFEGLAEGFQGLLPP